MILDNVRAVLFDMDETLIENTWSFHDIACKTFACFEQELSPITFDEFWRVLWSKAIDMWSMMLDGVLPGDTARLYTFVNTLRSLESDPDLAESLLMKSDALQLEGTRMPADTVPVLAALRDRGMRLGIVTNGYTTTQRSKTDHHALHAHVDFILVSEEVGSHKPDRRIFDRALEHAGVAPAQALFVGDMPEYDIAGATSVGMRSVLIDFHGQRGAVEGVPRIVRLSQLLPMLGIR